ncbi:MAG: RNA polymerase sigma factor [Acidimicrobiia bacterium]
MTPSREAIEAVFREEHGLVLSGLVSYTGDFQLAEDSLQDAFVAALGAWRTEIPDRPAAWLNTTARRKAIDRVRRAKRLAEKYETIAYTHQEPSDTWSEKEPIPDQRLRLIFTCCHPALAPDTQVALTLRTVGGLTTGEIAKAFLVSETTMAQRLVRAKKKIRDAGIPYKVPEAEDLEERHPGVLRVIYLIFNEGYTATSGAAHVRTSLTAEAIRLARIVNELMPDQAETIGLLALMQFHDARSATRTNEQGAPVLLPDQDRSQWDRGEIDRANTLLAHAVELRDPGPYQIQAAIASLHASAPSSDDTDWAEIVALYRALRTHADTPVIQLNQAVAIAMSGDRHGALSAIDGITALDEYPYLHAAKASLLADEGRVDDAIDAYRVAAGLTDSQTERAFLESRANELAGDAV